jgi:hypothetical protein
LLLSYWPHQRDPHHREPDQSDPHQRDPHHREPEKSVVYHVTGDQTPAV